MALTPESLVSPHQEAQLFTAAPTPSPGGPGFLCSVSYRQAMHISKIKTNFDLSGIASVIYNMLKKAPVCQIADGDT